MTELVTILKESEVPKQLIEFKIEHYKDVFKEHWEQVFNAAPFIDQGEELIVIKDASEVLGGAVIKKQMYGVTFRNFSVLPGNRGHGLARILMEGLDEIAKKYHHVLTFARVKPTDINMMYMRSMVYLDASNPGNIPALQFAPFLRRMGFKPYAYNKHELSDEESVAIDIYKEMLPDRADKLRVFKKAVIDDGVKLKPETQNELRSMTKEQWETVMGGLNWKLGNYGKTGKVSFRYDLCPICADMGSSKQDSENCQQCYIYTTCMEPFREIGRFKEEFEISHAYFSAMREFMLANKPKD